ncbi:MAG: hypothetical protein KME26_15775 [Oscillatoria princeps RMCB-10]|nr:hypothetical protein [Oscillatoria princeps RMCB-10]
MPAHCAQLGGCGRGRENEGCRCTEGAGAVQDSSKGAPSSEQGSSIIRVRNSIAGGRSSIVRYRRDMLGFYKSSKCAPPAPPARDFSCQNNLGLLPVQPIACWRSFVPLLEIVAPAVPDSGEEAPAPVAPAWEPVVLEIKPLLGYNNQSFAAKELWEKEESPISGMR